LLSQGISDEVDAETEEVLNEFSFLGAEEASSADKSEEWSYSGGSGSRSGGLPNSLAGSCPNFNL